jgi:hypothetical protein
MCSRVISKSIAMRERYPVDTYSYSGGFCFHRFNGALTWLSSPSFKCQTFGANRVAVIQDLVQPERWFYVDGKNNIADVVSRGVTPSS